MRQIHRINLTNPSVYVGWATSELTPVESHIHDSSEQEARSGS